MTPILLHLIDPSPIELNWARNQLSDQERARADAFVFPADAQRWTRVRAEYRRILAAHLEIGIGDIDWEFGIHDKPSIVGHGLAFNLSHGNSLSALAIAPIGPIGVDLEPTSRGADITGDFTAFCHPEEISQLPAGDKSEALIKLWTAKEAFLKALGTGLSLPPQQVCVRDDQADGPLAGLKDLHLIRPQHARLHKHTIAIAAPRGMNDVEVIAPAP